MRILSHLSGVALAVLLHPAAGAKAESAPSSFTADSSTSLYRDWILVWGGTTDAPICTAIAAEDILNGSETVVADSLHGLDRRIVDLLQGYGLSSLSALELRKWLCGATDMTSRVLSDYRRECQRRAGLQLAYETLRPSGECLDLVDEIGLYCRRPVLLLREAKTNRHEVLDALIERMDVIHHGHWSESDVAHIARRQEKMSDSDRVLALTRCLFLPTNTTARICWDDGWVEFRLYGNNSLAANMAAFFTGPVSQFAQPGDVGGETFHEMGLIRGGNLPPRVRDTTNAPRPKSTDR